MMMNTCASDRGRNSSIRNHKSPAAGIDGTKFNRIVIVNECDGVAAEDGADNAGSSDSDNSKSRRFWKRKKIAAPNNPSSSSVLVLSLRKEHRLQPLGITLRHETANTTGKTNSKASSGVYLTRIAPNSPLSRATTSRFLPLGSKILLVNGRPCPPTVKEVLNRLLAVPRGAVLTLHFELLSADHEGHDESAKKNRTSSDEPPSRPERPPVTSILKTPKYSPDEDAPLAPPFEMMMTCGTAGALRRNLLDGAAASDRKAIVRATELWRDEVFVECEQFGEFLARTWAAAWGRSSSSSVPSRSTPPPPSERRRAGVATAANDRWSRIRADELAEF